MLHEMGDPKVYRSILMNWISYQALAKKGSPKFLKFFTITANLHGSAKEGLEHARGMFYCGILKNEFMDIIDHILDVSDPLDRETSFLEAAKASKDLMAKVHEAHQSFDSYW